VLLRRRFAHGFHRGVCVEGRLSGNQVCQRGRERKN
jgi:hypothetical protein